MGLRVAHEGIGGEIYDFGIWETTDMCPWRYRSSCQGRPIKHSDQGSLPLTLDTGAEGAPKNREKRPYRATFATEIADLT
jgi:hypothetical protein